MLVLELVAMWYCGVVVLWYCSVLIVNVVVI